MIAATAVALSIAAIVISAAALAWTIGWSVYTHRRATRPSLTVSNSFALQLGGGMAGVQSISVTVANTGAVNTTLASVVFEIRGSNERLVPIDWLVQDPRPLSTVLAVGDKWEGMVALDAIVVSLRRQFGGRSQRIRAVARDATRTYTAEGWLTV